MTFLCVTLYITFPLKTNVHLRLMNTFHVTRNLTQMIRPFFLMIMKSSPISVKKKPGAFSSYFFLFEFFLAQKSNTNIM